MLVAGVLTRVSQGIFVSGGLEKGTIHCVRWAWGGGGSGFVRGLKLGVFPSIGVICGTFFEEGMTALVGGAGGKSRKAPGDISGCHL